MRSTQRVGGTPLTSPPLAPGCGSSEGFAGRDDCKQGRLVAAIHSAVLSDSSPKKPHNKSAKAISGFLGRVSWGVVKCEVWGLGFGLARAMSAMKPSRSEGYL